MVKQGGFLVLEEPMTDLIPVLDWEDYAGGDRSRARFVRDYGKIMTELGFVRLKGAPVDQDLVQGVYGAARAFFALPLERRMDYYLPQFSGQRGYAPLGFECYDGGEPEIKEWFGAGRYVGEHPMFRDRLPQLGSYFPSDIPDFCPLFISLYDQMDALAIEEMRILFEFLELDPDIITEMFAETDTQIRVVYYRDPAEVGLTGKYWAGPHCDTGCLTHIPAPTRPGLRLRMPSGEMVPAAFEPGEIVSNTGKGLAYLTGGICVPREHDVLAGTGSRMSIPCFTQPAPLTELRVPEELHSRIAGPVPPPVFWADFLREDLSRHSVHKEA